MNRIEFVSAASVVALLSALPGLACAQSDPQPASVDEVVVTGSRIQVTGFQQPTPVTVVGREEVQKSLSTSVANYINQLPSFGSPTSSTNPGVGVSGAGLSLLNLRSLGASRTLVLLDNRRVVNSSINSGVDTNTLPSTLIQRVEVVTGGASAAWGADAISGVVNFVLNHNFEGVEVAVQGGATDQRDNTNGKVDLTFGRKFLDGRASVVAAATYSWSPEIVRTSDRDWWSYNAVVNNPRFTAGSNLPRQITVPSAAPFSTSSGGVIVTGPLRGTQFVGSNGAPAPFDFGFTSTILQVGGNQGNDIPAHRNLTNGLEYGNLFFHARYDLTDNITAYAEGSYGRSVVNNDSLFYNRSSNLVIRTDNAFLNPTVRQALVNAGQTSFTMSKTVTEPGPPGSENTRELMRGVIGLNGTLGEWKWGAYYQRGQVDVLTESRNNGLVPRFNEAVDAVRNPTTGAIVCRSTLTAPTNGCVPYNVFGNGVASPEAIAYVFGTTPFQKTRLTQDFVSAEASGPVFALPAGMVTAAFGADASRERAEATQDEFSRQRIYVTGNFQPFDGEVTFKELFTEVNVPLLEDLPLLKTLELNAAGRMTHYSTSGTVYTWKVGLSDQITDDLRLRVTRSRDIRAPSLANLFTRGATGTQTVSDPLTNRSYSILANTRGNPELMPEEADTWTAGIVYRPTWVPGLAASVDFYDIKVMGAIASLTSIETVAQCFAGKPELCTRIIRDASNAIIQVDTIPTNIAQLATRGVDVEVVYRRPILDGTLNLRALGSFQPVLDETGTDGRTQHHAGAIGEEYPGQPKFKGQLSVGYDTGPLSMTAVVRFIGNAKLRNDWVEGVDVDDNTIDSTGYLDLRGSYDFEIAGIETRLSAAIDNVLGTDPRIVPATPGLISYGGTLPGTRLDIYDALGRSFRLGIRAKF